MKMIIEISEGTYNVIKKDPFLNGEVHAAIKNGIVLPEKHGRLIDADAFERRCMFDSSIEDMQDVIYALRDYKPIIEADKAESEDKK